MSTSITGDGRAAIEKKIQTVSGILEEKDEIRWQTVFEIERCVEWIRDNSFKKVKQEMLVIC